jgi:hypothetical protein
MKFDVLFSEARARIIWGEPSSSVRDFLTSNGVSGDDADAKIEEFCAERNAEIRKIGIRNTLFGAAIAGAAGTTVYLCLRLGHSRASVNCAVVSMVAVFYRIGKLCTGIFDLVRPQSEEKSIPDMEE